MEDKITPHGWPVGSHAYGSSSLLSSESGKEREIPRCNQQSGQDKAYVALSKTRYVSTLVQMAQAPS